MSRLKFVFATIKVHNYRIDLKVATQHVCHLETLQVSPSTIVLRHSHLHSFGVVTRTNSHFPPTIVYIISSKHSIHVSNRPFKIPETFLLLLNRNIYAHTLLLLSPYSPQIVARHDPSQKIGKINFLSRLSLSLSKKIFDQRKKGGEKRKATMTQPTLGFQSRPKIEKG